MNLSNKILLGFFGFIFLYLTAIFAELRLTGIHNVMNSENSIAETVDISNVAYVMLKNLDREVKIVGSDRAQLEVRSISGDLLKRMNYTVVGDTLTLADMEAEESTRIRITVYIPHKSLKGITVNSSVAIVEALQQEFLTLTQNKGRTWMSGSVIAKIQMDVSNQSFLDISATKLDTLSASIDGSEVHLSSPVGLLQGSMKNNAFLRLSEVREIQLKKDESSRLNLYE